MAEIRMEVRAVQISLICDECGTGEMIPTGVALMSSPPQYPHVCSNCGASINVRGKRYPFIDYESVPANV